MAIVCRECAADKLSTVKCGPSVGLHTHNYRQQCEAHSSEHPELPAIPGFEWPEDQITPDDKSKKVQRDAEKALDDAGRDLKKQIKKATGKP